MKFLMYTQMPGTDVHGTYTSFSFIPTANAIHRRNNITAVQVPQYGVPRDKLVQHKHNMMRDHVKLNPSKTPGLARDIRKATLNNHSTSNRPIQTSRAQGVYGVAQIPYAHGLNFGH